MKYEMTQCDQYGFSKNLTPCIYNLPVKIGSYFCWECPNCLSLDKVNASIECKLYNAKKEVIASKIVIFRDEFVKNKITLKDLILSGASQSLLCWLLNTTDDDNINNTYEDIFMFLHSNGKDADADWLKQNFKSKLDINEVYLKDCVEDKVYAYIGIDKKVYVSVKDISTFKWARLDLSTFKLILDYDYIAANIQELLSKNYKAYNTIFEFNNFLDFCKWIIQRCDY